MASILFGDVNPSGKLPFTYPKYPNDLLTYDHKNTEDLGPGSGNVFDPQYPFGHGLSYTDFQYSNLTLSDSVLNENGSIEVQVEVTNSGNRTGKETVMMFVRDHYAKVVPPVKRLRDYTKVSLEPGESKVVTFKIDQGDLKYVGPENTWILEPGSFTVIVGDKKHQFVLSKT